MIGIRAQNLCSFRLNNQHHILRDLFDHRMSKKTFSLIMNKMFIRVTNVIRKIATGTIWMCESSSS